MKTLYLLLISIFITLNLGAQNKKNPADNILGRWMSGKKTGIVEIFKRGPKFYGKLIWIKDSIDDTTHKPKLDKKNLDVKLQERALKGLEILTSFQYVGENNYKEGNIYDPANGKTYDCKMKLSEDGGKLDIRGYIGISLIGRTENWTRIKEMPK